MSPRFPSSFTIYLRRHSMCVAAESRKGPCFPVSYPISPPIDAIECGIVKVPRVPVQDVPGADLPIYRHVYRYMPRAGRRRPTTDLDPRLSLDDLRTVRASTIAFHLSGRTLDRWFRDADSHAKPWLFPSLLSITRRWMDQCLHVAPGGHAAYLIWPSVGDKAAGAIYSACLEADNEETTLRPILDPYNPVGSSRHIGFNTTKTNFWTPSVARCQVNLIVGDGDWEAPPRKSSTTIRRCCATSERSSRFRGALRIRWPGTPLLSRFHRRCKRRARLGRSP